MRALRQAAVVLACLPVCLVASADDTPAEATFHRILTRRGTPSRSWPMDYQAFHALPPGLQDLVISWMLVSPVPAPPANGSNGTPGPTVRRFYPGSAGPGDYVLIDGALLSGSVVVYCDGAPVPTWHWLVGGQTVTSAAGFQIPADWPRKAGQRTVEVRDPQLGNGTTALTGYSPRGYRGTYGWNMPNKGAMPIPWEVYRNYFGVQAVEFADGTHRPAAQAWYDSLYKRVGGGGNCYGFALMSLRARQGSFTGLLYETWWNQNPQVCVTDYATDASTDAVWRSIQEMQASQVGEPQWTVLTTRMGVQDPSGSWETFRSLLGQAPPHGAVMLMRFSSGGHATVPYRVAETGSTRTIVHYDSNVPWSQQESGGPDTCVATVYRNGNTFRYYQSDYTFDRVAAFDLEELVAPHCLPVEATEPVFGAAAGTTYLIVPKTASVAQITDEAGHTFYAGGRENQGPSRIPGAYYAQPIMGAPVPDSYPRTWLFTNSTAKSLTVEMAAGAQPTDVQFIQRGVLTTLSARGPLHFSTTALNTPGHRLVIGNPGAARIDGIRVVALLRQGEERTFEVRGIAADLDKDLEIGLSADRGELQLTSRSTRPTALQVVLRTDAANTHVATQPMAVNLAASQAGALRPANWRNLRGQDIPLELRTLQGARTGVRPLRP